MLKRYEQSVRVVTAFYAVLLGFGLKNLVDGNSLKSHGESHWLLLILASLFFLRFLLGSANHLWIKYVSQDPQSISALGFLWDIIMLIVFGVIGLSICYADSVPTFLWRNF